MLYKSFENPNFSLLADITVIKVYYETHDDLLEYRIKSTDQKVRRTKLSALAKSRYYNFLKKLDKIIKYRFPKVEKKLVQLQEEIRTMPDLHERDWLLEKVTQALDA
ncbi:MAG: hypothetical protein IPL65_02620 [Lewinellaceae bacterium]|nr:hypothetical protein [Lewinellaceae bacterium]